MARKTTEKFIAEVNDKNPNVEVLGQYVDCKTRILVRCKIDGYEWNADPRKLLRGTKCAVCSNRVVLSGVNDIATTHSDFVKYFKNPVDATKYVAGSEKSINAVCPMCGYEKNIKICNLIRFGFACNECYKQKYGHYRASHGHWTNEVMQEYLDENCHGYVIIDSCRVKNRSGSALKVLLQCPNLNHKPYWTYWKNILDGYQCELCYREQNNQTKWNADKAYELFNNNGFCMLNKEDYVDSKTPVAFSDTDGFIYMSNIGNMQKYASGERKSFSKYVGNPYAVYNIQHFCELYRPDYSFVSTEYTGSDKQYIFRYNGDFKEGMEFPREFYSTINLFINRYTSHPALSMSNGECLAVEYFNKHKIKYIPQKRYDDCKDVYTLPFDFYLPDYNLIIEIMGEQHAYPIEAFGGQEKFDAQIRHDKIKRDYLKSNQIHCLDIWYYEFDQMEKLILDKIQQILNNTKLI